jgi:hypothetical protein
MFRGLLATFVPLLPLCAPALFAQTTGSITGTVKDKPGAVVAKPEVCLTNTATQTALKTKTNIDGEFLFAAMPASQVETESSEVSGLVTGREITQLVLNGRNYTQLISLTTGVSNQTGQEEGTLGVYGSVAWSVNGGGTKYNNWKLDSGDNMANGSHGTLNVYPNADAIQEVRILTSD